MNLLIDLLLAIITAINFVFLIATLYLAYLDYKSFYTDDYKSEKAINYLRQNYPHKPLYVFSNRPEFYTELDTVPPVYFPLKFPGVEKYYPNYETNIMNSIKRDNIERVVFVMPLDTEFENQKYLKNWIMQNSVVEYQDENTQIRLIRHVRNQSQF